MRRFRFVSVILLALILSLCACAPTTPKDPFIYAESPFSLFVEGTYLPANDIEGTPRLFTAQIKAGEPVNGDPTCRDLTVTFTSPDTLAGLTITASLTPTSEGSHRSGTVTRVVTFTYPSEYGRIEFAAKADELDGFLRFAEALLPIGDVAEVSPKAADGNYTVTRRAGEREAVFTFGEGKDHPVGVRLTDGRGTVELRVAVETQT